MHIYFCPTFDYNPCYIELSIPSNIEKGEHLVLKEINKDKLNINDLNKKLNSLTSQQKQCLSFLPCSCVIKSKVII